MKSVILICVLAIAYGQQLDCVQQKEDLMKCKKGILTGQDSKNVQDQQKKIIEKCVGKDTVTKCLTKSDECLVKAEETAESSTQKKQALQNAAKCWSGNTNRSGPPQGGQMPLAQQRGGPGGPNGQGPMSGGPPPMQIHPQECLIPVDPSVSGCLDEEEKNVDEGVTEKLNKQMKDCLDKVSPDCIPRNPNVDMCMHQAYAPVLNITMSSYRQCMTDAGYKFPTEPQMPNFPGGPPQMNRPNLW